LDYAIGLHPAKLLDEHLLGNRRDRTFQVRKAQDLAAKQVKQDDQLPAAFEDFECVLNALRSRDRRQFFGLTFWCVPYFVVRSCHFVGLAPCWSHCKRNGEIMPLNLPAPVAAYIAAENGDDVTALAHCFAENAVVQDEGHTMKGLAAIQRWKTETKQKYHHTVEPLAAVQKDGKTVVTGRLTGEFPGSPVELQFVFGLEGDRISSLEISS
jgi:hypothetical protein